MRPGTQVRSPAAQVSEDVVATLVRTGGYTHPLFADADAPLMGQGVLLLAGGLAEQTGMLEHAIALVGLEDVRFSSMARPGTTVTLVMELLESAPTTSGRCLERYAWTMVDQSETVLMEAVAVILTRSLEGSAAP